MKITLTAECEGSTRSVELTWDNFTPVYPDWLEDLLLDLSSSASVWKEFWLTWKQQ